MNKIIQDDREKEYVKQRTEHIKESLRNYFDGEKIDLENCRFPIISVCHSGGGFVFLLHGVGVIKAIMENSFLDLITYMIGVSGGDWFIVFNVFY